MVYSRGPAALAWTGALGLVAGFTWVMARGTADVRVSMIVVPALFALTYPLAAREARRQGNSRVVLLILAALALKLAGGLARYLVAFKVYDGVADATTYHDSGVELARSFRQWIFTVDFEGQRVVGTNFLKIVTGAIYTVIGPFKLTGFLVFSWIGFLGLFLLYRAFRLAVPDGDHRRYAKLVFLLPSLLFWPSAIGKDAWIMLGLGLSAYGAARILTRMRGGYFSLAIGLAAIMMVRPHIAMALIVGLMTGFVLRRSTPGRRRSLPGAKVVGLAIMLAMAGVVVARAETVFGVDNFGVDSVAGVLDNTEFRTTQGGTGFEAARVRGPADFPEAVVSVLFRPFPWEAKSELAMLTSLEGIIMLGAFVLSWRGVLTIPRAAWRQPYVAFCLVYSLTFVFAFSSFGNFGLIARQRAQVIPFVLVLLTIARPRTTTERGVEGPDRPAVPEPATI